MGATLSTMPERERLRIRVRGSVQGVGFRPFVYRRASELGVAGWVANSAEGVTLEAEGATRDLDRLVEALRHEAPAHASVTEVRIERAAPRGERGFVIRTSETGGLPTAAVLPDLATCQDCLREVFDPSNRRYRYPFANCTACGPRFSIIEDLPYDRARTTMRRFAMCRACRAEYEDPLDRRFHAEPNACPECGPQLALWDAGGTPLAARHVALERAIDALRSGLILAVKGLGGFHLMVDARDQRAVARLRARKRREEKPLALMFPSLAAIMRHCEVARGGGGSAREPRRTDRAASPGGRRARRADRDRSRAAQPLSRLHAALHPTASPADACAWLSRRRDQRQPRRRADGDRRAGSAAAARRDRRPVPGARPADRPGGRRFGCMCRGRPADAAPARARPCARAGGERRLSRRHPGGGRPSEDHGCADRPGARSC